MTHDCHAANLVAPPPKWALAIVRGFNFALSSNNDNNSNHNKNNNASKLL
jgi:hypothetical protein